MQQAPQRGRHSIAGGRSTLRIGPQAPIEEEGPLDREPDVGKTPMQRVLTRLRASGTIADGTISPSARPDRRKSVPNSLETRSGGVASQPGSSPG